MSNDLGNPRPQYPLTLTTYEDYQRTLKWVNGEFPTGARLFIKFELDPHIEWDYNIEGSNASIKIESEEADEIPDRTQYTLLLSEPTTPHSTETVLCTGRVKRKGVSRA